MAWSNKAERRKMVVEKARSFGFLVRVEDKLHENILQIGDECYFTVRPVDWIVGTNDNDIINGTQTVPGNGIRVEGSQVVLDSGDQVFRVNVQAAETNLDPEEDWWYDITYVRNGYSMTVVAGEFEVAANVTNRTVSETFSSSGAPNMLLVGIDSRNLLNVTASMPMPQHGTDGNDGLAGRDGTSVYHASTTLNPNINGLQTFSKDFISAPEGRAVQVGDIVFGQNRAIGRVETVAELSVSIRTFLLL